MLVLGAPQVVMELGHKHTMTMLLFLKWALFKWKTTILILLNLWNVTLTIMV